MAPQVAAHDVVLPVSHHFALSSYIIPTFVFVIIPLTVWHLIKPRMDPMEPQLISPRIPLIGHTLDLLRHGPDTWMKFHRQAHNDEPIVTLPSIGIGKMYMATNPKLVTSIFDSQTLQFTNILTLLVQQLIPLSPRARRDFTTSTLFTQWIRTLYKSPASGPQKDALISRTLEDFKMQLHHDFPPGEPGFQRSDIGMWVRDTVSQSALVGLLGDVEWARDGDFIRACWIFEWDLDALSLSLFPSLTHSKAYKAVQHAINTLGTWLIRMKAAHGPLQFPYSYDKPLSSQCRQEPNICQFPGQINTTYNLSPLALQLLHVAEALHWSRRDKVTLLLFLIHVGLSNLTQTVFWCFMNVFSDKQLVTQLQEEIACAAPSNPTASPSTHKTNQVIATLEHYPLLQTAFQETQRLVNSTPLLRYIPEDTIIREGKGGREYLLKKGGLIFVPRTILSHDEKNWGTGDTRAFTPTHFIARATSTMVQRDGESHLSLTTASPVSRGVFFPFGGGRDICPARHIATSIVLRIMIALLTAVDIEPEEGIQFQAPGSGPLQLTTVVWRIPRQTDWRGRISWWKLAEVVEH